MNVLLTGGLGYIGSHTAAALVAAGHTPILLDNLANADLGVHDRLAVVGGVELPFVCADVRDTDTVARTLIEHRVEAVVHFAGLKAVAESVHMPLAYFDANVGGTLSLLRAMDSAGVRQLVFSSSAAVYGTPRYLPVDEAHPTEAITPYSRTKLHIEEILADLAAAGEWRMVVLRYFNPVGAHPSGLLGERPQGTPNNLMPFVAQVAAGEHPCVEIFGDDYDTPDGTGIRDYIHVMDLAEGHLAALQRLFAAAPALETFNLGTGRGYSVREMIAAFAAASGQDIPSRVAPRRGRDVASCYADPSRAAAVLGWRAKRGLAEMCESAWRFQTRKP